MGADLLGGTRPPPAGHSLRLRDVQARGRSISEGNPAPSAREVSGGRAAALDMPSAAAGSLAFPGSGPRPSFQVCTPGPGSLVCGRHLGLTLLSMNTTVPLKMPALPTKVPLVEAVVFPVVVYGCESWTIKKAEY